MEMLISLTTSMKPSSLAFQWTPNVLTLGNSESSSFTPTVDPLMEFLLAPLFDYYTTFGHRNQRHPGPLSNLDSRELHLLQFLLSEGHHLCTYLKAGP